jgi:hypothetical protein
MTAPAPQHKALALVVMGESVFEFLFAVHRLELYEDVDRFLVPL